MEPTTAEFIEDIAQVAELAREAGTQHLTGRRIATLLFHTHPKACKKNDIAFKQWGRKGKWKDAAKVAGLSAGGKYLRRANSLAPPAKDTIRPAARLTVPSAPALARSHFSVLSASSMLCGTYIGSTSVMQHSLISMIYYITPVTS